MGNKNLFKISLALLLSGLLLTSFTHPVKAGLLSTIKDRFSTLFSQKAATTQSNNPVLGNGSYESQAPYIFINGGNNSYSSGGLISQATTDEPAININGYKIPSELEVRYYKAQLTNLLSYLVHDKDGNQINKTVDTNGMEYQGTIQLKLNLGDPDSYSTSRHSLPLTGRGLWYLEIKGAGVITSAYLLRSDHGVAVAEGDNELIFWAQDYQSLRKKEGGSLKLYNLLNSQTELTSANFGSDGIAKTLLSDQADFALSQFDDDFSITPINLTYLNLGYGRYKEFHEKVVKSHYFSFTDKPLYQPTDTVHFKSIIRDDDDAEYSIPKGVAYATLSGGNTEYKEEKTFNISADGSISGEFELKDLPVGYYSIQIQTSKDRNNKTDYYEYTGVNSISYVSFQVEHYRKPELFLEANSSESIVSAGTPLTFTLSGEYFAGQPLSGENLKYRITAADYYEYNYLQDALQYGGSVSDDYRYGSWYGDHTVKEGVVSLDKKGKATLEIPTDLSFRDSGKAQVFMLEASLDNGEQDATYVRKNVLVRAGRLSLYGDSYIWGGTKDKALNLPLVIVANDVGEKINNQTLDAKITRTEWKKEYLENEKYPRYTQENFDVDNVTIKTNAEGKATLTFTPTYLGSYQVSLTLRDSLNNLIKKDFDLYVSAQDMPAYNPTTGSDDLSLTSPKDTYSVGDTIPLSLASNFKDRDVLLRVERGRTRRFQIVSMNGKSHSFDLKVTGSDQPNIYLTAVSFSNYRLDSSTLPITVSTRDKRINITLTPDRAKYGPGDTVTLKLKTTNDQGAPLSSEVALWTVDKSLYELIDERVGDIFETFWNERVRSTESSHSLRGILVQVAEGGGGCFLPGTEVTLADGSTVPIEKIKPGDLVQTLNKNGQVVLARVSKTFVDKADGYLIINGSLNVTPDHILNVNDQWVEASRILPGDYLRSVAGATEVTSVAYQSQKVEVYNLEVENEHTFIAGGVWVHNQKGESRSVFKDVAYWNPTIQTNNQGEAEVTFKLPDNLTTWVLNAVGSTRDTKVGQTQFEIKTSKDIVIKPILPNLVRTGDKLSLSAIARNFTDKNDSYTLNLDLVGGTLDDANSSVVSIKSNESIQPYWRVKPNPDATKLQATMSITSQSDSSKKDAVTTEIPVLPFGFKETSSEVGRGSKTYDLKIPKDALNDQTKVTLSLAPSILTSLQPAMKYLLSYPYGCVEQLTSALIPNLYAKQYGDLFPDIPTGKDLNTNIQSGLTKLVESHNSYSGWGWWSHAPVNTFVTSYVLESLLQAKAAGYDQETKDSIVDATNYLMQSTYNTENVISDEERVIVRYGLSLVNKGQEIAPPGQLGDLDDDLLAMAVIGNYRLGDKNPESNGLNILTSRARSEGNSTSWKEGHFSHFGSRDASTAWAIRAILIAGGDRELALAGANYLIGSRQSNYWSSTYSTALTLRALFELYKDGEEGNPNYSYTVKLDGKTLKSGSVNSVSSPIPDISIPVSNPTHTLEVMIDGDGQLYSQLVTDLNRTDSHADSVSRGLTLTREYSNANDPTRTIGIGDIVEVKLTVSGDVDLARQGVIEDQLPAGLIPINDKFKNEQYETGTPTYNESWATKQFTQTGVVLSSYNLSTQNGSSRVYTYKARVVSMGTFIIPPATASLMYSPEIMGRTRVDTMVITAESKLLPGKALEAALKKITPVQITVAIIFIIGAFWSTVVLVRRYRRKHNATPLAPTPTNQVPPLPNPPTNV